MRAQVLDQLIAILSFLAAADPGVAERPAQLPHHLPQRQLLTEQRHLFIGNAGTHPEVEAGLGAQMVAQVRQRRRLEGQRHLTREPAVNDIRIALRIGSTRAGIRASSAVQWLTAAGGASPGPAAAEAGLQSPHLIQRQP